MERLDKYLPLNWKAANDQWMVQCIAELEIYKQPVEGSCSAEAEIYKWKGWINIHP